MFVHYRCRFTSRSGGKVKRAGTSGMLVPGSLTLTFSGRILGSMNLYENTITLLSRIKMLSTFVCMSCLHCSRATDSLIIIFIIYYKTLTSSQQFRCRPRELDQ